MPTFDFIIDIMELQLCSDTSALACQEYSITAIQKKPTNVKLSTHVNGYESCYIESPPITTRILGRKWVFS